MTEFKKLTENDIDEIMRKNDCVENYLTDRVNTFFTGVKCNLIAGFEYCFTDCESPIEQMIAIYLESFYRQGKFDIPMLVDVIAIEKQKILTCNGSTYRVDFAIPVSYWDSYQMFVIECDGNEFHQKTKEQVERDNKRTRDLQLDGYTVIRFSGTEVYHKPYKCALEIKRIIQSRAIKFLEGAIEREK